MPNGETGCTKSGLLPEVRGFPICAQYRSRSWISRAVEHDHELRHTGTCCDSCSVLYLVLGVLAECGQDEAECDQDETECGRSTRLDMK